VTTYYVTVSMGDSAGAPDQNLFETVAGDTGSTTADAVDDTLTIAGGTGITTAVSGDTLTITTDGRPDQNLFETVAGDTGSTTADAVDDTLTIAGDATTGVDTAVSGDTVTISLDLDALPTEASTKGVTSGGAYTAYAGVLSALGAHTSNAGIHIDWRSTAENLSTSGTITSTGDIETTAGDITASGQVNSATAAFSGDVTVGGDLTVDGLFDASIARTVIENTSDLDDYNSDGFYAWSTAPSNAPGSLDDMMMDVVSDGTRPTQTVWGGAGGVRMFFRRKDGGTWQSWQEVFIDNGSGVLSTDTISESTSDTGVTVDGLLIKDGNIPEAAVTEHEAAIDHDELTNAGGNQHIDWTSASDNLSTSGTITSTGDISTDGNVYINASGPESDAFIDFFKGVGTARISWDSTNTRFNLNRQLSVDTSIETPGYIIIDNDGSLGEEAYLYFFDGGQYLKMRTDEDFEMSQDLVVPSLITDTVSESTSGNGVVVDGVTLKDGGISVTGTIDITGPSSDITTQGAISATGDIESTAGDVIANGQIEGATGAFSSDVTIGGNLTVSGSTSITISRTVLDSGDDLDSYTTDGRYAWAASVPTNAPGGLDNMMMNVDGDGSYPTQMVWGGDGGVRMFFRRRDGGTWQSWQEAFIDGSAGDFSVTGDIETTAGDITASGQVNAATGAFSSDVTISGDLTVSGSTSITEARVVLDATDDLDDFTSDGKYAWASGDLPTNAPVTDSMMMNVDGDGYYPTQTVWGGAGGVEVYYRRRDGGTWQSWRQAAILDADGELTVDDNIKANGNVYVDADGSTSNTGYLFFAGGVSKYLAWDGTNERFAISDTVNLGGNASTLARALLAGGPGIYSGSGSPEGAVTAAVGSTYHRTDGGSGTSFYVKESGTGNTGWVAK